jgi:alpha-mannosidase
LNHFADISAGSGSVGLTLSNADCYFMKLGNSTTSALDENTPLIRVLAGGRVVNAGRGLPDQGGDSHFLQRFALQSHGTFDPTSAMRFALEHQNPLIAGEVSGGSAYPANSFSLLTISDPDVLLWALKPSEGGATQGLALRTWNLGASPANTTASFARDISEARRTTHIETDLESAPFSGPDLSLHSERRQLITYRLKLAPAGGGTEPPPSPQNLRISNPGESTD